MFWFSAKAASRLLQKGFAKVSELTGGNSLASNIQLVYNNAMVAAKTAVEYCKL